jgi:hypothetical protein
MMSGVGDVTYRNAHRMSNILYSRRQTLKRTLAGEGVELTRFSPAETIWTKCYRKATLAGVTAIQPAFLDASRTRCPGFWCRTILLLKQGQDFNTCLLRRSRGGCLILPIQVALLRC